MYCTHQNGVVGPRRSPFIKACTVECLTGPTCKCCSLLLVPASRPEPRVLTTPRLSQSTCCHLCQRPWRRQPWNHLHCCHSISNTHTSAGPASSFLRKCCHVWSRYCCQDRSFTYLGRPWSVSTVETNPSIQGVHYSRMVSGFVTHGRCALKAVWLPSPPVIG